MEIIHGARPEQAIASTNVVLLPVNITKRYEPLSDVRSDFDADYIGREIAAYTIERIASDADDAYCALVDAVARLSSIANRRIREAACSGFASVASYSLMRGIQSIQHDSAGRSPNGNQPAVQEAGI